MPHRNHMMAALPGRFAGHRRHGRDLSMARYPLYFVMGIGSACGACKSPRVINGPPQPSRPHCSHYCTAVPAAPWRAAAVCSASGTFAGLQGGADLHGAPVLLS